MKNERKISLTNDLTKPDLVALAVYLLGGDQKSIDTEDIAIKINQLMPGVFVWKKYPDQINFKLIEAFLYDAKKTRCGELLLGTSRHGWRLSAKGIEWISKRGITLLNDGNNKFPKGRGVAGTDPIRIEREKRRLLASEAWGEWSKGTPLKLEWLQQLFRIDDYTTPKMLESKVVRLRSLFNEDSEVSPFLAEAASLILRKRQNK